MNVIETIQPRKIGVWKQIPAGVGIGYSLLALKELTEEELQSRLRKMLSDENYSDLSDLTKILKWAPPGDLRTS
jgi:hypothetical protein